MKTKRILGQPSWKISSDKVTGWLTERGGQLGPVTFTLGRQRIQPFAVAPWAEEKLDKSVPAVLRALRGDFFCLPFGGNAAPYRGERHPVHGETANAKWKLRSLKTKPDGARLHARLRARVRPGHVDKWVRLATGQTAVYQQHVVSEMSGPMPLGHHAMLKFPDEPGSGLVATSPFLHGWVLPDPFEDPAAGGYQALKPGAAFATLASVPTLDGQHADLSRYPARRGFEDLALMVSDPALPFAWTAVTFPRERFVWFALKDPRVLRATVFWISNGGRHMAPWSGRHRSVMGLEEVTSYFHLGLAASAKPNPLSAQGVPTTVNLQPRRPLVVNYIMAVAAIPAGFEHVREIQPVAGGLELVSVSGQTTRAAVDVEWLSAPDQGARKRS